jgi:hypothetical protein
MPSQAEVVAHLLGTKHWLEYLGAWLRANKDNPRFAEADVRQLTAAAYADYKREYPESTAV